VLTGRAGAVVGAAILAVLAGACSAAPPAPQPATHTTARPAATATPAASSAQPSAPTTRPPSTGPASTGIGTLGRFNTARARLTVTEPAHTGPSGVRLGPRRLLIQLWYPLDRSAGATKAAARGPLPLIAFGPGFMQCGGPYADLLRAWASAGYVVAAVNFPRSDCLTGAAATESDLVNQPAEMSYAITALLRRSAAGRGLLGGRLDRRAIAISGQSDGGDTVAAIGGNSCCSDRRVRAVAVLSGAEWPPMPGRFFAASSPVPMLFTQGSADTVNLPGCSVTMYRADPSPARYYLDLAGADHTEPYWGTNAYQRVVVRVTVAFFDRYVLGQRAAARMMRRAGHAGVARLFGRGRGNLTSGPCVT
jgi:dienelactone hydrolase